MKKICRFWKSVAEEGNRMMSFWESCKLDKKDRKVYAWVFGFSLLYIAAILIANVPYFDDWNRAVWGYGWNGNGRILLSLISCIVHGHSTLMDIAPWSQILGVALLDYGLVCYVRKLMPEATIIKTAMVAAFAYVNLLLLENLAYRYDSLGMMLGLGLVFFLFSLPQEWSAKRKTFWGSLVMLLALYIYQVLVGTYLALVIVEVFVMIMRGKNRSQIVTAVIPRMTSLVIGAVLWKLSFMFFVAGFLADYSLRHSEFVNFFTISGIYAIYQNILKYGHLIKDYFQTIKYMEIVLMVSVYVGLIRIVYDVCHDCSRGSIARVGSGLFVLLTPLLLLLVAIAPLTALKNPVVNPRVLMAISVFTLFQGYMIYQLGKYCNKLVVVGMLSLVITLSHAAYFGNLRSCQYRMNEFVISFIVRDINDIERELGKKFNKISKAGPYDIECRELLLTKNKGQPLYYDLIRGGFKTTWILTCTLNHYRMGKTVIMTEGTDVKRIKSKHPIRSNEFYRMYVMDDKIVIAFEKRK